MMTVEEFLKGPSKRDVAGMKAALSEVSAGDVVSVLYKSARYGHYLVTGTVHCSFADELMVGGQPLAGVPKSVKVGEDKQLQRSPDKEVRAFPADYDGALEATACPVSEISHGDLVATSIEQAPYGRFVVTGVVTAAENDGRYLMIGPWILNSAEGENPRILEVQRLASAGEHQAPKVEVRAAVKAEDLS
ncbi:hypothetical protein [Glutamicibacter sp. PS]|uniref:hypothetical protein n=1 Tax=Glutamicibacter sp. PS TaxID=3075634 RepID=UPI0028506976|nr:hypothetical protein [Glutamicibacter sp. PS]MDR4532847.1 hypothetical protein [Glutamicibacter sp. PS]